MIGSCSEEGAKSLFTAKADRFKNHDIDPMEVLLDSKSLILQLGEDHVCMKRQFMPIFHDKANLSNYKKTISNYIGLMLAEWEDKTSIDVKDEINTLALKIIIGLIFGAIDESEHNFLLKKTQKLLNAYTPAVMFIPVLRKRFFPHWRRFCSAKRDLDAFLLNKIECSRNLKNEPDHTIFSKLINLKSADGNLLDTDYLLSQFRTLLIAGHETTANSLIWSLLHIYRDPQIRDNLLQEFSKEPNKDVDDYPYLDAVIKETFRLYPPVPFVVRTIKGSFNYLGIELKEGDVASLIIDLLHRSPAIYENPNNFMPERFLSDKQFNSFQYCPFGGGLKKCIGYNLAPLQMKMILHAIVQNFQLSLLDKKVPRIQSLGLIVGAESKKAINANIGV